MTSILVSLILSKSELLNFAHLAAKDLGESLQKINPLFDALRDDFCGTSELEINMLKQANSLSILMHKKLKGLIELALIDISQEASRTIALKRVLMHF